MTDTALGRRRATALASLDLISPPTHTLKPASARQLFLGWPLVWAVPTGDLTAWIRAQQSDRTLPRAVKLALTAAGQCKDQRAAALDLASAFDVAAADDNLSHDRRAEMQDCATRARLSAAFLGDGGIALAMAAEADARAACSHDDAERRLLLTTGAELRYASLLIESGAYRPDLGRAEMREVAWSDLAAAAEVVNFWLDLERVKPVSLGERLIGAVRDDTGFDPRDADWDGDDEPAIEPEPPGIIVIETAEHLPGTAKDGSRPVGGSTPRAEAAPIAGRRIPCKSVPDLTQAHRFVVDRYPHAADLVDRILRPLAGCPFVRLPPILLVGPAGCGKTSLAMELAAALDVPATLYGCAGVADGAFIGTSRQWSTGRMSVPLQAIKRELVANPIIVLDEIEKAGESRHNGSLHDGLLAMLDHSDRYMDPYLECRTDLSGVSFIATANGLDRLPRPLRDRFWIVVMPEPDASCLPALARGVMAHLRGEMGLDEAWIPDLEGDELSVVGHHWRGGSVRILRRLIETVIASRDHLAPRH